MKKTLLAVAATMIATQAFAQLRPNMPRPPHLIPGPSGGQTSVPPPYAGPQPSPQPVGNKIAQAYLARNLNHGDIISVRRELNDLMQGDLVKSLEGVAQGRQRGAYLEVVIDAVVVARVDLSPNRAPFRLEIRKVNGVDYQRLVIRSIGSSYVESIAAVIGEDAVPPIAPPPVDDDNGVYPGNPNDPGDIYPGNPSQPPPLVPGPPGNQNPPHQPPPLVPGPPGNSNPVYPPNNNSLAGYCDDYNHSQFTAAKNFAYATAGLDMSADGATNWALNYNQSHACNTIEEYRARFTAIKNFAYATAGLDMSAPDATRYALDRVETINVLQIQQMQTTLTAIKNFAYASSGLDLSGPESVSIARNWIERGYCEDQYVINNMAQQYSREFNFAYSGGGLNYDKYRAKDYALSRIRQMSVCSDLLR
ncbi:MAG: hypothetical protein ABL930_07100 [Pseudobdellovibrio sp.]